MSVGDAVEQLPEPNSMAWPFLFTQQDWGYTPLAVHASLRTRRDEMGQLHDRVETLEVWLKQHATTALRSVVHGVHHPGKAGGKPGHWALARYITLENEASCGYLSAKTVRRFDL